MPCSGSSNPGRPAISCPARCTVSTWRWICSKPPPFSPTKAFPGRRSLISDGRIAGVVSEKDFLAMMGLGTPQSFMQIIAHCLQNKGCIATVLRNHSIREIMTSPAITAGPDISLGAISALFKEKRINRLPIVDAEGRPVGIVTRTDLVHSYCFPGQG